VTLRPFTVTLLHPARVPVDLASGLVFLACAIAVFMLARRRLSLGVGALFVLAPFDLARYAGSTTITTLKAGLVGLIVALVLSRSNVRVFWRPPVRAIAIAFVALLGAIVLSAWHAQHLGEVLREGLKNAEYLLLFAVAVACLVRDPDDAGLWRMLEAGIALVCISALSEYALGAHNGMFLHGKAWIVPRIAGVLEGPNQLAGYLDVALPLLVARALLLPNRVGTIVLTLAALTDLLTISRGGIFGAIVGILAVAVILRPPVTLAWRYAAAAVAVVIAAGAAFAVRAGVPPGYFSLHQQAQAADHLGNRAELWHAAVALWRTSPITGVGAGNYELDLGEVGLVGVRTHANSLYLQALAELGLVGFAATIGLLVTTILVLARSALRQPLVVGALGATFALGVHQVLDDMFFFPKVASGYWIVVGCAVAQVAHLSTFRARVN
jgi:O-antigen ligase